MMTTLETMEGRDRTLLGNHSILNAGHTRCEQQIGRSGEQGTVAAWNLSYGDGIVGLDVVVRYDVLGVHCTNNDSFHVVFVLY